MKFIVRLKFAPHWVTSIFTANLLVFFAFTGLGLGVEEPKKDPSPTQVKSQATQGKEKVIVFVGDSLTQGYGVKAEEAFPEIVKQILLKKGYKIRVINGGISGSVSADADRRIAWYLKSSPDVLILALGANDGMKGTPTETIKKNLATAIDLAKSKNVRVLLCGMEMFSNLGETYTKDFAKLFRDLASEKRVALIPFLLKDVALKVELNQSDGKHPNARGHQIIAESVARELEKVL